MSADQFADLQAALLLVFGQPLQWVFALLIAFGFIGGVFVIFLSLFSHLSRGG